MVDHIQNINSLKHTIFTKAETLRNVWHITKQIQCAYFKNKNLQGSLFLVFSYDDSFKTLKDNKDKTLKENKTQTILTSQKT